MRVTPLPTRQSVTQISSQSSGFSPLNRMVSADQDFLPPTIPSRGTSRLSHKDEEVVVVEPDAGGIFSSVRTNDDTILEEEEHQDRVDDPPPLASNAILACSPFPSSVEILGPFASSSTLNSASTLQGKSVPPLHGKSAPPPPSLAKPYPKIENSPTAS